MKLPKDILELQVEHQGQVLKIKQNHIDPCIFMIVEEQQESKVRDLLLTHVDDILLLTEPELTEPIQKALQERFPVDEWVADSFEYVGCEYQCSDREIKITQKHYTSGRVDKVLAKPRPHGSTSKEQIEENRTTIGSLSWLAKQTRPDTVQCFSSAEEAERSKSGRHQEDHQDS